MFTSTRRPISILFAAGLALPAAAQCPPDNPTGLSASQGLNCASIAVDWSPVTGSTGYRLYRNTTNDYNSASLVATPSPSNYTDPLVLPETRYYYWVVAVRSLCLPGNNLSGHSAVASGYRARLPVQPDGVEATDGTYCGAVRITWFPGSGPLGSAADTFRVYRNTVNVFVGATAIGTGNGVFLDTTGTPGVTYHYWVRAENVCGNALSEPDSGFFAAISAPVNDTCAGAINVVSGGSYNGSTFCAGTEGRASCGNSDTSPDVWYRFVAPADGTLHADTCSTTAGYDTVLSVHLGCPGTVQNQGGCNDDACPGLLSSLDVPVSAGVAYSIRVSGFNGASGTFLLRTGFSSGCYANCDASTTAPVLNVNDFVCFQTRFAAGDPWANCDGSTGSPTLNVNDFICFQTAFAAGCR